MKSLYISYNAITEPIVQSQVIPYLRELSKKGIEFYLLTFEKKRMDGKERRRIREELKKEWNLNWFSLNYHKKPTATATLFDIVMGCLYGGYLTLKNRIKIIHARAVVAALMGYPVARFCFKKFIFDKRGVDSEEYVDAGLWKRKGFKHKAVGFLEAVLTKFSDHVVVLTEKFLKISKERYAGKKIRFSAIPCAVDMDRFKRQNSKDNALAEKLGIRDKFVITYVGSLGTWYMFPEMVDFFQIAAKHIKNAHFLILTNTDKNYAIDIMKKRGLDSRYVTIDSVKYQAVPDYLSVCDCGIFFIKPVFSKLSSSPIKFGEYLASGLPVIINSDIGDTEEIVKDNKLGIVVRNFDESGYGNALTGLMNLLKDEKLANRCRSAATKHLSLDAAVEKYNDIYKKLLLKI